MCIRAMLVTPAIRRGKNRIGQADALNMEIVSGPNDLCHHKTTKIN